jgi:hypothetical protein
MTGRQDDREEHPATVVRAAPRAAGSVEAAARCLPRATRMSSPSVRLRIRSPTTATIASATCLDHRERQIAVQLRGHDLRGHHAKSAAKMYGALIDPATS